MLATEWNKIVVAIAESVKNVRFLLGWSQQQLADRAVTSQGTISRIESGNHADLPFHTVVIVIRTLASAATSMELVVTPATRALITFVQSVDASYSVVTPIDPELRDLLAVYHGLTSSEQIAMVRLVRAMCTFRGELAGYNT